MQLQESIAQEAIDNPKRFESLKKNEFTSYVGYPGKPVKTAPTDFFSYLLHNYPQETLRAYAKVSRYTVDDLKQTMDTCLPDMAEPHRNLAIKVFEDREKDLAQVLDEYYKETGLDPDHTLDEV